MLTAGVVLTIVVWIAGGWAFVDPLRNPSQSKPAGSAAEKSALAAAEKSSLSISEKPAVLADKPSAAGKPAEPTPAAAEPANKPPKPPEPQSQAEASPGAQAVTSPVLSALPQSRGTGEVRQANESAPALDDKEVADPAARQLILQGWAAYYRPYSPVRWQEARGDFERALEIDPRSSEARIGLASILSTKLADGWSPVLQEDIPRAERLLLEAMDKGDVANRMGAHFTLGLLRQMQNRLPEARNEFNSAISLDPNNARAHLHLGETLLYMGEPQAAIPPLEQAIRLRPDDPNIAITYWALGTCQLLLGRADQAIDQLQAARAANPRLWVPYFYLAGAYGLKGDLDRARSALAESIRLKPALRSLTRMRAENPWLSNQQYSALQEKTLNRGLQRAGLSD